VALVKTSLRKFLRTHLYHTPSHCLWARRPRRLHRWCIKHLARYLRTFRPQRLFHVLTFLDPRRRGLCIRDAGSTEQRSYEALQARLASLPSVEGSTLHRCGRCGATTVDYFQKQCRSADEAMTCFFTCQACGNRWKT